MKVKIAYYIAFNDINESFFADVICVSGNKNEICIMQETPERLIPHYFEVSKIRHFDITKD